ncbi:MAG: hypothetical protein GY841_07015, partial [FCB group bacterium]|nr:hypothetical protein [FCB group bacterium]
MWRLAIRFMLLLVVAIPITAESSLDHTGITLFEEQSNYPELSESVSPTSENPWTWTGSGFSGFTGSPTVWFEYQNGDHTIAKLHWSGFEASNWQSGVDGSFTLTLSNGVDEDRVYSVDLSLRCLIGEGYTWFKQQTGGSDGFSAAGANGFVMLKTGSTGLPGDLSLTFNAMGAVTACAATSATWTEDGTINLI